jgi:hypothetical protein
LWRGGTRDYGFEFQGEGNMLQLDRSCIGALSRIGSAMGKLNIGFCVRAAAGMLLIAIALPSSAARAVPLAGPLSAAAEQAHITHRVPYACRRDAYGRVCTYVSPWDRNLRSNRPHASGSSPYYQAQPYSGSSGYNPFYWANPQGSD